jgi:hypothetical protein
MAIALVGDLFDKHAEQDTLLRLLTNVTDRFGWPTSYMYDLTDILIHNLEANSSKPRKPKGDVGMALAKP